jgi:hypothetical protein
MEEGFKYVYARQLRAAMNSGEFQIISFENYRNEYGQPGVEYVCEYRGRRFYCSESRTEEPSQVSRFIAVLKDEENILDKQLIWPNRKGEDCLYLEASYREHWYKFHTPMRSIFKDEFDELLMNVLDWEIRQRRKRSK